MQQLAEHVYLETGYPGVTLAAMSWPHGLVLIDSPFRVEDIRSWRSTLLNLGGGIERILINLDAHFDRTLGVRGMDCTVLGHESMAQVFRNRPVTFKAQGNETGAEWESHNNLGSIRWSPPEITFTDRMRIHWDDADLLVLEHRPGSSTGAIWATLPDQRIVFVGDAVVSGQPPFLASAELSTWIESLNALVGPQFEGYQVVSGRGGVVSSEQIQENINLLTAAHQGLESLAGRKGGLDHIEDLLPGLLERINFDPRFKAQYAQRLRHGLRQYFIRRYQQQATGESFEE